jgi:hypothetical protein
MCVSSDEPWFVSEARNDAIPSFENRRDGSREISDRSTTRTTPICLKKTM